MRFDHGVEQRQPGDVGWSLAGAAVALAVAGVLVPVRDNIGATNVAIVLVIVVVVAAALGGRTAGPPQFRLPSPTTISILVRTSRCAYPTARTS
jgi:hypothetical protein